MSATDELRRMLTEAGVEWTDCSYKDTCTAWSSNGVTWYGLWRDGSIELMAHQLTPEQAISATIGDTDATPTRQDGADLAAENAKLRERIHELEMEGSDHFYRTAYAEDANRTLEAENAKLRELVRDAWGSGHPDKSCGDCEIRDECHDDIERLSRDGALRFSRCLFELRIEDRMRELGIEVNE